MSEPKRTAEAALSYGVAKADLEITTLTIAERRAQYLALAQRRVRPGSGSMGGSSNSASQPSPRQAWAAWRNALSNEN